MKLSQITAMIIVSLYGITNANSAPSGAVVHSIKAGFEAGTQDRLDAIAASAQAIGEAIKATGNDLAADAEKLQHAIKVQNVRLKSLDQQQRKLYQYSNDPQLKAIVVPDAIKKNSDEMAVAISNLSTLERNLASTTTSSSKLIKYGDRLGKGAGIAGLGLDVNEYRTSERNLIDSITLAKNIAVAVTSEIPGYGLLIDATDLATDVVAEAIDRGLDKGRKESLLQADRIRLFQDSAYVRIRKAIERDAENGIALSSQEIHSIQIETGKILLKQLSTESIENNIADGDVAEITYQTAKQVAEKFISGFNLDELTAKSKKLAEVYNGINDYNRTMQGIQKQQEEINSLIARMEQSTEKLSAMNDSLEQIEGVRNFV